MPCIEDEVIDLFTNATTYLNDNQWLGLTLLTISNVLLDVQLILIWFYWFLRVENFRFLFSVAVLCVLKMIITVRVM